MISFTNLHVGTPTMTDYSPHASHTTLSPMDPGPSSSHEWDPSFSHLNGDEVLSNWESATAWVRDAPDPLPPSRAPKIYAPSSPYMDAHPHASPYGHSAHAQYHGHEP